MGNLLTLMSGAGLGAGLMYVLDPEKGPRRRAILRDQMAHALNQSGSAVEPTLEDLSNRARGLAAEARAQLSGNGEVTDNVLVQRVRSKMGRYVSHPGSILVMADNGRITLHGPILEDEVERLLEAINKVPGVREVDNRLSVHETRDNVPGLQDGDVPRASRPQRWSPAKRFLVGSAGGALTAAGGRRGGVPGKVMGLLGLTALVRAISNKRMERLAGVGAGRRAVDVRKDLDVMASPQQVYEFWSNFENFPRFMAYVREVKDLGEGRSHWVVEGPAGTTFSWDAEVTEDVPGEMIAWRTTPGTPIENAGIVHFRPNDEGGTKIHVQMSYNPPAGAIGHVVADLLGHDPETAMHDDLARFKSLVEAGKTTADGVTVTREEVAGD